MFVMTLEYADAAVLVVAPSVSRIATPLNLTLFSQRLLEVQKFDSEHFTSLPTITRILPRHTGQDPCLLSTLILLTPL